MNARLFTASIFACAFAIAGCSGSGSEQTGESGEALSHASVLVDAWNLEAQSTGDFTHLVLKADGTYFSEKDIVCIKAPCINPRATGTWSSSSFYNTTIGTLTLHPNLYPSFGGITYSVSIAPDNSGMKLGRNGHIAYYDRAMNFCDTTPDCAGQPVPVFARLCMVNTTRETVCTPQRTCEVECVPNP
jgi:hypothetical protein